MKRAALVLAGGILVGLLATTAWRHEHMGAGAPLVADTTPITSATPLQAAEDDEEEAPPAGNEDGTSAAMGTPKTPATKLVVAFKMDPAITRGLYLGDRWVSPPSYAFSQEGDRYVVRARAQLVDGSTGERVDLDSAQWATTDPDMVGITPGSNGEVEIAVDRAGTAQLRIKAAGEEKVVQVASKKLPDAMEVDFRQ